MHEHNLIPVCFIYWFCNIIIIIIDPIIIIFSNSHKSVPGDEPSVLEDPIEGSSNDSSLMEADDVQLQAMETDEEL